MEYSEYTSMYKLEADYWWYKALHELVESYIKKKFKGKDLEGLTYKSVLNGRTVKVILGDYVTLEQGTGCVHTAPGHGYDLGYGLDRQAIFPAGLGG